MKNFITNLFHVIGIIFFVIVLWIILLLTGILPAFLRGFNMGH